MIIPKNCLTYAICTWFKYKKETGNGGYIKIRKSLIAELHGVGRYNILHLVPHFLHETVDGKVTQLVRNDQENARAKKLGPWFDWLWLWRFEGKIVEGDILYTGDKNDSKT